MRPYWRYLLLANIIGSWAHQNAQYFPHKRIFLYYLKRAVLYRKTFVGSYWLSFLLFRSNIWCMLIFCYIPVSFVWISWIKACIHIWACMYGCVGVQNINSIIYLKHYLLAIISSVRELVYFMFMFLMSHSFLHIDDINSMIHSKWAFFLYSLQVSWNCFAKWVVNSGQSIRISK